MEIKLETQSVHKFVNVDVQSGFDKEASCTMGESATLMVRCLRNENLPLCARAIDRIVRIGEYVDEIMQLPGLYRPDPHDMCANNSLEFGGLKICLSESSKKRLEAEPDYAHLSAPFILQYVRVMMEHQDTSKRSEYASLLSAMSNITKHFAEQIPSREKACDHCGFVGQTLKCSRCKKVWYCNKTCQRNAWVNHGPVCT
jgi:predicted Zn-ribbon and HTH transcriptional regulator